MGRLRSRASNAELADKTVAFFRDRALQFYTSGHSAIAADYVIRGLILRRRDSRLLQLGVALGNVVGQSDLAERCRSSLRDAKDTLAPLAPFTGTSPERLTTPCTDCEPINSLLAETIGANAPITCASFSQTGRGLQAVTSLPRGAPIFAERPMFVQRRSAKYCSQCLAPLVDSVVACGGQGCTETYCSEGCRTEAAEDGHAQFCDNAECRSLVSSLQQDVVAERRGNASVALSVLVAINMVLRSVAHRVHPLTLPGVAELSGAVSYEPKSTLDQTGAIVVRLGAAVGQPHLVLEDFLTLFGKVQTNEFVNTAGCSMYRCLSMLNHSCVPNAEVSFNDKGHAVLTPVMDIQPRQQIFIDYTAAAMRDMPYARRAELLSQRHFECFCPKCVKRI